VKHDEAKIFDAVKRILRVAEQSTMTEIDQQKIAMTARKSKTALESELLNKKIGGQLVEEILSKTIFGRQLFFVVIATGGIAALLPDKGDRLMFAGFAAVCQLVAVCHVGLTGHWIRKAIENLETLRRLWRRNPSEI
jgi:hypothetical protein